MTPPTENFQQPSFADWLDMHMRRASISQRALAERLGIHETNISRWKSGRKRPSFDSIAALCDILRVSLPDGLVAAGLATVQQVRGIAPRRNPADMGDDELRRRLYEAREQLTEVEDEYVSRLQSLRQTGESAENVRANRVAATELNDPSTNVDLTEQPDYDLAGYNPPQRMRAELQGDEE